MKQAFINKKMGKERLAAAAHAVDIVEEYDAQGYTLTLRQLYYQFVSRALVENTQRAYKWLGSVVADARMLGLLDWDAIEDRTRNLESRAHLESPEAAIQTIADIYHKNLWDDQGYRLEIWVEKEALASVVERVAKRWDVPYFSCRGYPSLSEMYATAQRCHGYVQDGACGVEIIHLGDHDPSGIDMTRDIGERLETFFGGWKLWFSVNRIALNMDQVEEYKPPPNPAKTTDSRARGPNGYIATYGEDSWELDALEPSRIETLIEEAITDRVDTLAFDARKAEVESERELLNSVSAQWPGVTRYVKEADQNASEPS